jgi:16S rRNA (guanine527-N7)-methyltransferase
MRVDATPPLPTAYEDALAAGLADIGVELTTAARAAIDGHVRMLLAWNRAINLTAIRDPGEVAVAHVVDSLAALAVLRKRKVDRLVDLGSGGGFPGLPLAIALPAKEALLADSIGKKVRFLETVVDAVGLAGRVGTHAGRAEALARDASHRERWPAVTVRAVAALPDLVELAFPLLEPGGVLIAWKRGEIASELAAAGRAVAALGGGTLETRPVETSSLAGHCLVVAGKEGATPDRFPRDPALRRRSPW